MVLETLLIDLDDTVYPASVGLWSAIRNRMDLYLEQRMGFPGDQVPQIRHELFTKYGTTLRGLQAVYHVDEQDFLAFVHDLEIPSYLQPNPNLERVLNKLPFRKVIFTNADDKHANRVLNTLGISSCFEQIIDIKAIAPYCKPMPQAFSAALILLGSPDPSTCLFVDDSTANLDAAQAHGLFTALVSSSENDVNKHPCISRLEDLHQVIDNLPGAKI